MNYTEFTGKTVEEAVEKGLQELGLSRENADIRVLEEGKRKLFGSIKARVEIAAKEAEVVEVVTKMEECSAINADKTDGERAVAFLEGLFKLLNITACTELVSEGEQVEINVTAANNNSVIGKRGATLDAIQTLAGAVANTGREDYLRVVVDCENYRENRETTLNKLAENLAQKAIRYGKKIKLEPMNPYERRIIHATLTEREGVKTLSEGKEPNRYIVIIPDNLEDPDAPAMPARAEKRGGRDDRRGGYNRGKGGNRGGKGGYKKPYNNHGGKRMSADSTNGGTTVKKSNDFFGIYLGNSNKND